MPVRAILRRLRVEGWDDPAILRVYYPALPASTHAERQSGQLAPDPALAPYPVVLFLPGVNCPTEGYYWLAERLAAAGLAVVLLTWVTENLPGRVSYTPGIDLEAVSPAAWGQQPLFAGCQALQTELADLNTHGPLMGMLDLERLAVGGHSAGGTLALYDARRAFYPNLKAAFAYCANPLVTLVLGGWPAGEMPPLPAEVPSLLLGAEQDGISIEHNRAFGRAQQPIEETWRGLLDTAADGSYLAIYETANHHTICHPRDDSVGRTYLDAPETGDAQPVRAHMADLILAFLTQPLGLTSAPPAPLAELTQATVLSGWAAQQLITTPER